MVAVTAFFSLLIAVAGRRLCRQVPPAAATTRSASAIHGSLALELLWTFIPLGIAMVMFAWGAKVFFDLYRPPAGAMEVFVVGKQWMWKVAARRRAARDQRAARADRPAGQADHGLGGRHPQLLHPGVPREGGRDPRPLQLAVVHGDQAGPLSPVLRRVLRHEALGDDRLGHRRWSRPTSRPGSRGGPARRFAGRGGREAVPGSGCNTCHQQGPAGRGPALRGPLRQDGRAAGRRHGHRRRSLPARVDREPAGEGRRRLPADHADVPGPGDRRAAAAAHRLRAVARASRRAGAERRRRTRSRTDAQDIILETVSYLERRPRHRSRGC